MVPWANVALLVIGLDFITGLEMEITVRTHCRVIYKSSFGISHGTEDLPLSFVMQAPKHGSTLALDAAEWLHVTV